MGRYSGVIALAWATAALSLLAAHALAQGEAAGPSRYRTQVVTDGPTFWVYTIDTTTGGVWFLDRQHDGVWEWIDDGAAPGEPGAVGKYQLVPFANDKGAHVYVCDTTTGDLWLVDEENLQWLPRNAPRREPPRGAEG